VAHAAHITTTTLFEKTFPYTFTTVFVLGKNNDLSGALFQFPQMKRRLTIFLLRREEQSRINDEFTLSQGASSNPDVN